MALDDEDFPSPSPATRMVVFPTATQGVAQAFAYPPNFGSNNWRRSTPRNNYAWPNQQQSTHMIFTHCHNPLAPRYPCDYSHFAKQYKLGWTFIFNPFVLIIVWSLALQKPSWNCPNWVIGEVVNIHECSTSKQRRLVEYDMSKDTSLTHLLQCHKLCMALLLPTILQCTTISHQCCLLE